MSACVDMHMVVVVHTDERAWGAASTGAAAANLGFERIEMHAIGFKEAHLFEQPLDWAHVSSFSTCALVVVVLLCCSTTTRAFVYYDLTGMPRGLKPPKSTPTVTTRVCLIGLSAA